MGLALSPKKKVIFISTYGGVQAQIENIGNIKTVSTGILNGTLIEWSKVETWPGQHITSCIQGNFEWETNSL